MSSTFLAKQTFRPVTQIIKKKQADDAKYIHEKKNNSKITLAMEYKVNGNLPIKLLLLTTT